MAAVRKASEFGVNVNSAHVDFAAVMERMRRLRAGIAPNDAAERFRSLGVDVFLGVGQFTGRDTVAVNGKTLRFRKAVLATGTTPAIPDLPGLSEVPFLTNETVFALTELPQRLVILGAGPIACELGQAFARLGSKVTIVARSNRLLGKEDPTATAIVRASMEADGVTFQSCVITRIAPGEVHHEGGTINFDRLFVATGRKVVLTGLGLESAGIETSGDRLTLDDRLRTSNPRVYAVGDVATTERFTHAADATARLVLRNALFRGRGRFSKLVIPRCTYTDPELASVGIVDDSAGDPFRVDLADVDRAILDGESTGFVKVIVARGTDRILGATAVGGRAGEVIGEIANAMSHGLGLRKYSSTVRPYPTFGEVLRKLGDAANKQRLTPLNRWLLKKIMRWF